MDRYAIMQSSFDGLQQADRTRNVSDGTTDGRIPPVGDMVPNDQPSSQDDDEPAARKKEDDELPWDPQLSPRKRRAKKTIQTLTRPAGGGGGGGEGQDFVLHPNNHVDDDDVDDNDDQVFSLFWNRVLSTTLTKNVAETTARSKAFFDPIAWIHHVARLTDHVRRRQHSNKLGDLLDFDNGDLDEMSRSTSDSKADDESKFLGTYEASIAASSISESSSDDSGSVSTSSSSSSISSDDDSDDATDDSSTVPGDFFPGHPNLEIDLGHGLKFVVADNPLPRENDDPCIDIDKTMNAQSEMSKTTSIPIQDESVNNGNDRLPFGRYSQEAAVSNGRNENAQKDISPTNREGAEATGKHKAKCNGKNKSKRNNSCHNTVTNGQHGGADRNEQCSNEIKKDKCIRSSSEGRSVSNGKAPRLSNPQSKTKKEKIVKNARSTIYSYSDRKPPLQSNSKHNKGAGWSVKRNEMEHPPHMRSMSIGGRKSEFLQSHTAKSSTSKDERPRRKRWGVFLHKH